MTGGLSSHFKGGKMEILNNLKNIPKNTLIGDFDTVLFTAAKSLQEDYIIIRHNEFPDWTQEFSGVQEFYGKKKAKDGGWIGEQNAERLGHPEKNQWQISHEDFTIEPMSRIVKKDYIAYARFNDKLEDIMEATGCADYRIVIGGEGNFRYDVAQIQAYKGTRKGKPVRFAEIREYVLNKYKDKVIVVDGIEGDDVVSTLAHKSFLHFNKTGEHLYTLAYVDKDLKMCICPYINYNKIEDGVLQVTPLEAAYSFCRQMLMGDSTDTIPGLPGLTAEICKKYGIKKTRGLGEKSADNLLTPCDAIPELFGRVVEAYRSYYGDDEFEFESYRGEKSIRTWFNMLDENCQLLFMRREHFVPFDLAGTLTKLGIEYE